MYKPQKKVSDRISLAAQRHLINNFKTATEMGAEIIQVKSGNIPRAIVQTAEEKHITTICIGRPHLRFWQVVLRTRSLNRFLNKLSTSDTDLIILS